MWGLVRSVTKNMAAESVQAKLTAESCKKRRGSYFSYLSNPSEKVPRTSEYRQKLPRVNSVSTHDKSTANNGQTIDNTIDFDSCQQKSHSMTVMALIKWKSFSHQRRWKLMQKSSLWRVVS